MRARSRPIEEFKPREAGPRTWGSELIIAETPFYLGKILSMKAGTAGGLQYHVEKDESFYLLSGTALVDHDPGDGLLNRSLMLPGQTYHIPPGAVHRVTALTDCVLIEASTVHFSDRVRVEDRYGEPETEGLPTTRQE